MIDSVSRTFMEFFRSLKFDHVIAVLGVIGTFAQVVTAYMAVLLAKRANETSLLATKMAHEAIFIERALDAGLAATQAAEKARDAFRRMFLRFDTAEQKAVARTEWANLREHVQEVVAERCVFLEEFRPALAAWEQLEDPQYEPPHVLGDDLEPKDPSATKVALDQYDRLHSAFIRELHAVINKHRRHLTA